MRNNKQGNKLKYNKKTFNRKAGHLHEIILLPKQKQKNWRETDAYAQSRLITAVTPMVEICYAHAQTKCPSVSCYIILAVAADQLLMSTTTPGTAPFCTRVLALSYLKFEFMILHELIVKLFEKKGWSSWGEELRNCSSIVSFKNQLKSELLSKWLND